MQNVSGLKIAQKLHLINSNCMIFFVTNHASYLDEAFNQHAFRFWTKPLDKEKLKYRINSAIRELNSFNKYIKIFDNNKNFNILSRNIVSAFTKNRKVIIVTTKTQLSFNCKIRSISEQLSKYNYFCEIGRCVYINFNYIEKYSNKYILLDNNKGSFK